MYIETERLIIRSIETTDEQAYTEMASDGSLHDILGDCDVCQKRIASWVREAQTLDRENRPDREYLAYAVTDRQSGNLLGSVGCSYYEDLCQTGLCCFMGALYRGKGYAAEAAAAYTAYLLSHYDIPRIIATVRDDNTAAWKTVEKIGFTLTEIKMYRDINDEQADLYRFYEMPSPVSRALAHWGMQNDKTERIYDTAWQVGNDYVLKVYHDLSMLQRNLNMLTKLDEMNIPVGRVVFTCDNRSYVSLDNAFYFLSEKLPGSTITRIDHHQNLALEMGEIIARLHAAFQKCEAQEGIWNNSLLDEMKGWVGDTLERNGFSRVSREAYEEAVSHLADLYAELPVQLIHRDIHSGNFLFAEGVFSGYIDFDLSQRNIRIFDICYFMLGLLSRQENLKIAQGEWMLFLRNVIRGYEKEARLSPAEKRAVPYVMECIELLFVAYFEETGDSTCADDAFDIFLFIKARENAILNYIA